MRQTVHCLPPHSFRTLSHLLAHLHLLSQLSDKTGMTSRNLALVWAPNLLRPQHETIASEESLRDIGVQARVVEFLIDRYEELFMREKEARRLRGNLSCQDVSFLPVTNPRTFHGSYSNLQKTLARCEETGGAPPTLLTAETGETVVAKSTSGSVLPFVLCCLV